MKTILFSLFITFISTFVSAQSEAFNGVRTSRTYKDLKNHNPINTLKYSADPGVMVYDGRVYVYGTNDGIVEQLNGNVETNGYGQINTINVMSSDDLVNWVDHGTIPAAGKNGAAKWAGNSWAPCAAHKKINGKEKFFLYFANSGNGIGVLTSDSPTGPFTDPLGKPLITRSTPNCNSIVWLFDPAVLVDDDGTGYLYFGGGVPENNKSNPKTVRAVKLGADMISLAGNPVTIDAPWVFEDSGINKAGNTYFYSYCTNWDNGPYGNARIAYMTSNNPLGPFKYQGTVLNNPGDFFQTTGNNHHTIINFKNKWYIFYHAEWLNKQVFGSPKGYRTSHVDELPFSNGKFGNAKGSLAGVQQLSKVNPYNSQYASLFAWTGGVTVNGLGHTTVSYNKGDWTGVSDVDFNKGVSNVRIRAASRTGAVIRITANNENGDVLGYVTIPATGTDNNFRTVTAEIKNVTGSKNIFFTASGDLTMDTWQFFGTGATIDPAEDSPVKVKDGWYYIKNPNFNKYLQVYEGLAADAANVVIGSGRKDDAQRWYVTNLDDGFVYIRSALGNYNLDINRGSDANDANVQIYTIHEGNAQKFLLQETSQENVYIILTRASNGLRAIDIEKNQNNENQNVLQWTNENKANQFWLFEWDEVNNKPEKKPEPEPEKPVESPCWAEELGYKCCNGCVVVSTEDGQEWGVENDEWCGILPSCQANNDKCWAESLGYKCCKGCDVFSTEDGQDWGLEDDDWCGILPSCKN